MAAEVRYNDRTAMMKAEEQERKDRVERLKLEEGDYYFSPESYLVFTEQYHLKRGYCCQSGCRHCPFGFGGKPTPNPDR